MTHAASEKNRYTAIYRSRDEITHLKIRVRLQVDRSTDGATDCDDHVFHWQEKKPSRADNKDDGSGLLFSYVTTSINDSEDEVMVLMADLGEYVDSTWLARELQLCEVRYNQLSGTLSICPDFMTSSSDPYVIRTTSASVKYWIEHASPQMSQDDQRRQSELLGKINSHKMALLRKQITAKPFDCPPKHRLRLFYMCEIVLARNFDNDSIFIRHFVDVPHWFAANGGSAITQTSIGGRGTAHLNHTFDFHLDFDLSHASSLLNPPLPCLYFEAMSKDYWGRFRTEGLTYRSLPLKPGKYRDTLRCVRLTSGLVGRLRRFFIGDCRNYEDARWVGLPSNCQTIVNKYGTRTEGTGEIEVRIDLIQQSYAFVGGRGEGDGPSGVFDRLQSSKLIRSVEEVVAAFQRARKNVSLAREGVGNYVNPRGGHIGFL